VDKLWLVLKVNVNTFVSFICRYSGCYDTAGQSTNPTSLLLPVSQSLSAIASLTKSNSKFDIKASSSFLRRKDGERDTNRDSIAVVEDNRVELERLVEKINSDLTSAQKASLEKEPINRASSIELFLSSTAQPVKLPPKKSSNTILEEKTMPQQVDNGRHESSDQYSSSSPNHVVNPPSHDQNHADQLHGPSGHHAQTSLMSNVCTQNSTVTCTISDVKTLEILLTEDIKDAPVTDLDADNNGATPSAKIEITMNANNVKSNGILDRHISPDVDSKPTLSVDAESSANESAHSDVPDATHKGNDNSC